MSDLTVVIATRNRAKTLAGALIALSQQDLGPDVFDVRPEAGWARAVCPAFAARDVGLATGPIRPAFEAPPPVWQQSMVLTHKGITWSALWGALDAGPAARDMAADFVWGSNFLVRTRALREARGFHPGGMPASLFHFTGDGDVAAGRRIAAAGWRSVYAPEAAVRHLLPAERNGAEEVRRWIYGEGLVTSYVLMRTLAAAHPEIEPSELMALVPQAMPAERVQAIGRGYLNRTVALPDDIRTLFETAGPEGFDAHQHAFATDSRFREWVLRSDYLDLDACYTHPALQPDPAYSE